MSALPRHRWTEEEYLAFERASDTKHEYVDGEIYDMVGGSPNHNKIMVNVSASLWSQIDPNACTVFPSDQRVKLPRGKLYTYPDITVVCGEPEFFEGDTLANPTVIIEVLSPSTELYDRTQKFGYFSEIPSLRHYLLISQNSPHIEHFLRTSDDNWPAKQVNGLDSVVELPSIRCTLELSIVYRQVTFEAK